MPSKTSQPTQERNKFNKQGTSAESCALDSERHKGMGVGQSGNTLWRKYIFSRGLKEVKWRIYTEEKERRPALQKGKQQEQSPRAAVLNLFPSHGTHKLITKILQHTRKYTFCRSDKKKKGIILIHSRPVAIVVWAVVIFLFGNLKEKRSLPLTKWSGTARFKHFCGAPVRLLRHAAGWKSLP